MKLLIQSKSLKTINVPTAYSNNKRRQNTTEPVERTAREDKEEEKSNRSFPNTHLSGLSDQLDPNHHKNSQNSPLGDSSKICPLPRHTQNQKTKEKRLWLRADSYMILCTVRTSGCAFEREILEKEEVRRDAMAASEEKLFWILCFTLFCCLFCVFLTIKLNLHLI